MNLFKTLGVYKIIYLVSEILFRPLLLKVKNIYAKLSCITDYLKYNNKCHRFYLFEHEILQKIIENILYVLLGFLKYSLKILFAHNFTYLF